MILLAKVTKIFCANALTVVNQDKSLSFTNKNHQINKLSWKICFVYLTVGCVFSIKMSTGIFQLSGYDATERCVTILERPADNNYTVQWIGHTPYTVK